MKLAILKTVLFFLVFNLTRQIALAQMLEGQDIPEFGRTFGVVLAVR